MKTGALLIFFLLLMTGAAVRPERDEWYTIKFHSLCESRALTPERYNKYGNLTAYRIREDTLAIDTVKVSFDFISNCCETFSGKAEIINDTLKLSYYRTNAETCRCFCDYRFTYAIADTTKTWSSIKVDRIKKK